ncbi:MAG: type II secretion system F family protein [Calditrichaeota bacterium]|nr:type II secretion system F family protein [Calditrichota bacterium]
MPTFAYVAINESGSEVRGTLEAADKSAVERTLEGQDLMPLKITQSGKVETKHPAGSPTAPQGKSKKITQRDIIDFTRQFVTLIKAGVPILTSLETLASQSNNPVFAETLIQVATDISAGNDIYTAMSKHPKVFSELYCNAVRAGEVGGVLDQVLTRLTAVLQRDWEIRKDVKGALRYPIIVVTGMIIAFLVLTTFVVPKFAKIFIQIKMDLPLPTKILIGMADFLKGYWWLLAIIAVGIIFAYKAYTKTEKGQIWWDGTLLKLPIFGPLVLKSSMTRFTKMFETLSRSGLPILQIFDVVSRTIGNKVLGAALLKASESIEHGRGVAVSLGETGLFPPLVVRMIAVGEDSGAIDDMLANISEYYDQEVKAAVEGMTAMIEPLLTVGMGAMVILLALAIFLPMWNMMDMAQQGVH